MSELDNTTTTESVNLTLSASQTSPSDNHSQHKPKELFNDAEKAAFHDNSLFTIQDMSQNHTFIMRDRGFGKITSSTQAIKGKFQQLKFIESMEIRHLDIVEIRVHPLSKELLYGFQFLSQDF